jgi:hypothetical protein
MPLINMLPPEMLLLEQLRALRDLATELVLVFLFDVLQKLLIHRFIHRSATKLADISSLRFKYLLDLLLKGLDPVECALKLLLSFGNLRA